MRTSIRSLAFGLEVLAIEGFVLAALLGSLLAFVLVSGSNGPNAPSDPAPRPFDSQARKDDSAGENGARAAMADGLVSSRALGAGRHGRERRSRPASVESLNGTRSPAANHPGGG